LERIRRNRLKDAEAFRKEDVFHLHEYVIKGHMKDDLNFCDLMCKYAKMPKKTAVDGAGSCKTFIAVFCARKKSLIHKNMPCKQKVYRASLKRK
jgi:hypothetical protein